MLSAQARPYIDASVPVLREHGLAITTAFYGNLFKTHPELHNIFNAGNQANGRQQQSLASAVFAYAANIDNLETLTPVLSRIVQKHVSLGVTAEHYPIVGTHLLGAIKQILGDAATPELMAAWSEAYGLLAQTLIDEERAVYTNAGIEPGDLFRMCVVKIEQQSEDVKSFTLVSEDATQKFHFHCGQFVSVAVKLPSGVRQLRQYSLSDAPGLGHMRISVKREIEGATPAGMVSNWLHENLKVDSQVLISKPFGDFLPDTYSQQPIVLISAGIGITPMISALNRIARISPSRFVIFAHAAGSPARHSHRADVEQAAAQMPNLRVFTFYESGEAASSVGIVHSGKMQISMLPTWDTASTNVYMCGPLVFMQDQWDQLVTRGVPISHLHREVFGPDLLNHLL